MRKVIIYFKGDKITPDFDEMPGDKKNLALLSFGEMCAGQTMRIGDLSVGTVTDYRVSPTAVGLVVEWSGDIEQGQIIE